MVDKPASTKSAARAQVLEHLLELDRGELIPAGVAAAAQKCATRLLEDPGLVALVHVLEVEIFQAWRDANSTQERERALELGEGVRRFLVKLRELAEQKENK